MTSSVKTLKSLGPSPQGNPSLPPARMNTGMLRSRFGLTTFGGKIGVVDLQEATTANVSNPLKVYSMADGKLLIERTVKAIDPTASPVKFFKTWRYDPKTSVFNGVELNPKATTLGNLNLWRGMATEPKRGSWRLIRNFIYYVVCGGDSELFKYVLRWIAHAVQYPEDKSGVALLLVGGQGTGKGTFAAKLIGELFKDHFLHLQTDSAITGDFNASLESSYILFCDEAFFSGDRKAANKLKAIMTEDRLHINPKYQPSRQINSIHRIISASNNDHAASIEHDDRRYVVLRVSETYKGNFDYWSALDNEIKSGGLEAFAYALSKMELTNFQVRQKPNTREHQLQKLQSLDPIPKWWTDVLLTGEINEIMRLPEFVPSGTLMASFRSHNRDHGGRAHAPAMNQLIPMIKKLCPSAQDNQKTVGKKRLRGLDLPDLAMARSEFETWLGGPVDW